MVETALVVGAGIMGLCTAHALAKQGVAVRVIEQDPIPNPRGASVDHHRLIRHAYGDATGYAAMVDPAFAAWDALWADLGERLIVETGVLALATGPSHWFAHSRASARMLGLASRSLDAAGVAARYPMLRGEGILEAELTAPGGVLLADRIVAALARDCAARGVAFETARVASIGAEAACATLADGTTREADALVVAAGPWVRTLLPALPVTPSRQIVVYLEPPARHAERWAAAPMLLDLAADGGFYAVPPVAGTPLKLGDHRFSLQGDADDPREPSISEVEAILALAWTRLRDLADYRVLGARACYYDVADGERFVVAPLGPRAWAMSGFSGHGFKFAPLLGAQLARAMRDPGLAAALPGWAAGQGTLPGFAHCPPVAAGAHAGPKP